MKSITIDGVEYTPKTEAAKNKDGMEYVVVRTYSAGVHAGYLQSRKGKEVVLVDSRRLWYWDGAFTLSAVAKDGVARPDDCKFSCVVGEIILTEAIEIIPTTEVARKIIEGVQEWKN